MERGTCRRKWRPGAISAAVLDGIQEATWNDGRMREITLDRSGK